MRTRRSPRNQDRLWKALGHEGSAPAPPGRTPLEMAEASLAKARALGFAGRIIRQLERDVARERMHQERRS